jgi:phosphatidylserine/phosphatidylglycerophosphate/cardiolipin synthase-like enzyme
MIARRSRRGGLAATGAAVLTAVLTTACATAPAAPPPSLTTPPPGALSLLVEPDDGVAPIYALLRSARTSIDVTIYELADDALVKILDDAAARGVDVRVVLDANREQSRNRSAFEQLAGHGVHVVWADRGYPATHQKTIVVDDALAAVMTLNLTSRYYPDTRDFAVLSRQPADVAAISAVFDADFAHQRVRPAAGTDLLWSPGARPALLDLIGAATSTLLVEAEEMALPAATAALAAAARRGVEVTVVMTSRTDWTGAFDELGSAGVHVRTIADGSGLYIHAKAVIADAGTSRAAAFVGSQNLSATSLDHNRELGLVTRDPVLIKRLATAINADAVAARRWAPITTR